MYFLKGLKDFETEIFDRHKAIKNLQNFRTVIENGK